MADVLRNRYSNHTRERSRRFPRGTARLALPLFLLIFVVMLFLLARSMLLHHFFSGSR